MIPGRVLMMTSAPTSRKAIQFRLLYFTMSIYLIVYRANSVPVIKFGSTLVDRDQEKALI
jgi:hypothetical protein